MTTLAIRQKLITYIADANDSKVKALYTLLENDIAEKTFVLTEEQLEILEREYELHITGQSKSYTREEAHAIVRGQRDF